jgi:uncharacterized protein YdeI (BOF family)
MKNKALFSYLAGLVILMGSISLRGDTSVITLAQILQEGKGSDPVVVRGQIKEWKVDNVYLFYDGSGEIAVFIGGRSNQRNTSLLDREMQLQGVLSLHPEHGKLIEVDLMRWVASERSPDTDSSKEKIIHLDPIKNVLAKTSDNLPVRVRGKIVMFIDEDEFVISDGTGFILVEAESKRQMMPFQEGDAVEVAGKIELLRPIGKRPARPAINAYKVIPLPHFAPMTSSDGR